MNYPLLYAVHSANPISHDHRRNLLLLELSKRRKVVFLSDVRHQSIIPHSYSAENVVVVDNSLRLSYSRLYAMYPKICSVVDARLLEASLRKMGIYNFVPWITTAESQIRDVFSRYKYVYDCIDPCFIPTAKTQHDLVESQLIAKSTITFCTATTLLERCSKIKNDCLLVNNAVDERFLTLFPARGHHSFSNSNPMFLYLGTVDWRIDFGFLKDLALLGVNLVIAGRVNGEHRVTMENLQRYPNVTVLGAVSDQAGIDLLKEADVALLPYTPGDMNDSINSLKMYLYLAAGLPILSTAIRESIQNDLVTVCTESVTTTVIKDLLATNVNPSNISQRREFAVENTWRVRSLQVDGHLRNYGL